MTIKPDKKFMEKAIELAKKSWENWDYALGVVIVKDDKIIATGTTNLKHENDPTVHGEIVAIRNACKTLKSKYLEGCTLYTTHEPCPMCASAAIRAKMDGIVFWAFYQDADVRQSDNFSWRQISISCKDILAKGTPKLELVEWFERDECLKLFDVSK